MFAYPRYIHVRQSGGAALPLMWSLAAAFIPYRMAPPRNAWVFLSAIRSMRLASQMARRLWNVSLSSRSGCCTVVPPCHSYPAASAQVSGVGASVTWVCSVALGTDEGVWGVHCCHFVVGVASFAVSSQLNALGLPFGSMTFTGHECVCDFVDEGAHHFIEVVGQGEVWAQADDSTSIVTQSESDFAPVELESPSS